MASIQTVLERIANNYSPENLHLMNAVNDHANLCTPVAGSKESTVFLRDSVYAKHQQKVIAGKSRKSEFVRS